MTAVLAAASACGMGRADSIPWPPAEGLGLREGAAGGGVGPRGLPPGVVFQHLPTQAGGSASDTDFVNTLGNPFWEQSVDDIELVSQATIRRIVWWGFFFLDNPPATETMRVRFYDARPSDGLPGDVLFEESFLNPPRVATGNIVFVGVDPHEYRYQVDLTTPMELSASTRYWLEIVQVGDPATWFVWEYGQAVQDVFARRNPIVPNWAYSALNANLAFELWNIPEPSTALLLLAALCATILMRRRLCNRYDFSSFYRLKSGGQRTRAHGPQGHDCSWPRWRRSRSRNSVMRGSNSALRLPAVSDNGYGDRAH